MAAIAASGGVVYAGGGFLTMGGKPHEWFAAIDPVTGTPTAWTPGASGPVESIIPAGSKLYVGGSFDSIGGRANRFLAEVDTVTGMATAWNPRPNSEVKAIHVAGDRVYAGGRFTSLGGRKGAALLHWMLVAELFRAGVLTLMGQMAYPPWRFQDQHCIWSATSPL